MKNIVKNENEKNESLAKWIDVPPKKKGDYFHGYTEELKKLWANFKGKQGVPIQVISGLSGMGKTTLAREFIEQYADKYAKIVWWNRKQKELSEQKEYPDYRSLIDNTYKGKILFVLDDCYQEDLKSLPYKGAARITVLITSRTRNWSNVPILELTGWSKRQACSYVSEQLNSDSDNYSMVDRFCDELDCFPLVIVSAISYINEARMTLYQYLEEFLYKDVKLAEVTVEMKTEMGNLINNEVEKVWFIEMINFLSALSRAKVPISTLQSWFCGKTFNGKDKKAEEIEPKQNLNQIINYLYDFHFSY